jgi:hypothetical protein
MSFPKCKLWTPNLSSAQRLPHRLLTVRCSMYSSNSFIEYITMLPMRVLSQLRSVVYMLSYVYNALCFTVHTERIGSEVLLSDNSPSSVIAALTRCYSAILPTLSPVTVTPTV